MINKKYIVTVLLLVGMVMGAAAQPVMVERQGRAENIKSYYAPEKGYMIDFSMGYAGAVNGIGDYASQTPSPSIQLSIGYSFSKKWKAFLTYQNAAMMEDTGYDRIVIDKYQAVSGEKVHDLRMNNIMVGGEFVIKDFSQYIKPYVSLSAGMGSVKMSTEISDQYFFDETKWLPVVSPEVGMRGFFDKNLMVGYKVSVSYTQYFGDIQAVDMALSSPSFIRIAGGVFLKWL